ncbi:MAG: hydroxymethylbilane synthase, partial [SAR324 cluster bacterium]|nr:hydroxymethylbilane synthase [SAR324 cluster bacterium]
MPERPLLRIATRGSKLALWQAEHVRSLILKQYPDIAVELVVLKTKGDLILDRPLAEVGGKGLFVKELESAMLENHADLAVHSLKDVPAIIPEGLELSVILKRENPHDVLVFHETNMTLEDLPPGSRIGTSSLRRAAQLKNMRPDLEVTSLRGNVPTRLKKLDSGEVDAAVLAAAGLIRLELEDRINQELST